ncbi:hypothetical protein [Pseudomonas sp. TH31]|uniref:hypothetical protein n=1 Tax=Pseudomonas sp. TH31 TaxID=2796396 RepID=UPI0019143848|nr:hypothetical protein [Pseudomonas sp. TH31]MBK5418402.1 hypothetical protein [Pseudomonas sp. TH31]
MKGRKLWVVAFLAFMTNGASLLGVGQGSAGAVARSIECNHAIAHNIQAAKGLGLLVGNPPQKVRAEFLGPFQVDCSALGMCSVLA